MEDYPVPQSASRDSKNIALLMWLSGIFFSFIPGLLVYLLKTEDGYLADQSKESINWSITVFLGYAIGIVLCVILIGFLVLAAVWICNVIFCILGAMATSRGDYFRVPFAIRIIK